MTLTWDVVGQLMVQVNGGQSGDEAKSDHDGRHTRLAIGVGQTEQKELCSPLLLPDWFVILERGRRYHRVRRYFFVFSQLRFVWVYPVHRRLDKDDPV